jgi:HK97 family phage prohead protease
MADNAKKPYGDVKYADPGYQKDGKARYPVDTEDHVRAAWSYINQTGNAAEYSAEQLSAIKGRIRAAAKRFGIEIADDAQRALYDRSWALEDIQIVRSVDGGADGRTVEAYAAIFDTPAEIRDQYGHYVEEIDRSAFNRTLSHGIDKVRVYYHHGMTLHGTPSDLGSVPIGRPVSARADKRGLLTVTRYNKSQLADSVLEAIRNGDIQGYSFRGPIIRSNPNRPPRARAGGSLPLWRHLELGLREYGPTPTPAYADAGILAMRSTLNEIRDELSSLRRNFPSPTPLDPDDGRATPELGLGTEDSRDAHSARLRRLARLRAESQFLGAVKP